MRVAEEERDTLRRELVVLQERVERTKARAGRRLQALQREIAFLREYAQAAETGALRPEQQIFRATCLEDDWPRLLDLPQGEVITKQTSEKPFDTGMTCEQLFCLEVNCLIRLNRVERDQERKHFPILIDINPEAMSFTMARTGWNLTELREQDQTVEVHDLAMQVQEIVSALERAGVIHLDLHSSGKNLTVSEDGILSLIDFDYAALDGVPWSGRMRELLEKLTQEGSYRHIERQILHMVRRCSGIRVVPSAAG